MSQLLSIRKNKYHERLVLAMNILLKSALHIYFSNKTKQNNEITDVIWQ